MSEVKPLRRVLVDLGIQGRATSRHTQEGIELKDRSFENFLNQTLVELRKESIPFVDVSNQEKNAYSYSEFIKSILEKTGLVTKSNSHNVCETSFFCSQLNHYHWETLCLYIGRQNFLKLLCASSCFKQTNSNLLFLPSHDSKSYKSHLDKKMLRISQTYYRWRPSTLRTRFITTNSQKILYSILEYNDEPRNMPKKYRKLQRLLQRMCQNEANIDYSSILGDVVTQSKSDKIFDNCTPFDEVSQFVLQVTSIIFPHDAFGCRENQKLMKNSIIKLLKTSKNDPMDLDKVVSAMKLSSIKWLGKSDSISSLQDLAMRRSTLQKFMRWIYTKFLTSVVNNFWYVTENVNDTTDCGIRASFFLHSVWRDLTTSWLTRYSKKYLYEVSEHDELESHKAELNFGVLRLVPKKSDFRPLCVPRKRVSCIAEAKDFDDEKGRRAFKNHDFNFIRPIRDVLRFQQAKKINVYHKIHPKCYSVRDIGMHISLFKNRLLCFNEGKIPILFGVQFDMKQCYDNLNQAKIISCIEDLFESEHIQEDFIVKRYLQYSSRSKNTKIYKRARSSIKQRKNVEELDFYRYKPAKVKAKEGFIEKARIFKFSKDDILDVVRNQVLESVMKIPELGQKHFKRTIGVFQGLPLSETLCDIVYDALVNNVLTSEKKNEFETSLLLRLADDFLFISTKKTDCDIIMSRANSVEAQNYGAFVHQEKCHVISSETSEISTTYFLGLQIGLKDLSIRRCDSQRVVLSNKTKRSFEATLVYLKWRFKLKLSSYLLDLNLSSIDVVGANISKTITPIINSAMSEFHSGYRDSEMTAKLEFFLCEMISIVVHEFKKINANSSFSDYIFKATWNEIASFAAKEGLSMHRLQYLLG